MLNLCHLQDNIHNYHAKGSLSLVGTMKGRMGNVCVKESHALIHKTHNKGDDA